MRGFQIKSYEGKKYHPPPLILHRLKFRVFCQKKNDEREKEKKAQRGSKVKQTAECS